MVLYVMKYDISPGMAEQYGAWVMGAIKRLMNVPGVIELQGYRPVAGTSQVASFYVFPDMEAFGKWVTDDVVREEFAKARDYLSNVTTEVWGPSPFAPEPIRAGG